MRAPNPSPEERELIRMALAPPPSAAPQAKPLAKPPAEKPSTAQTPSTRTPAKNAHAVKTTSKNATLYTSKIIKWDKHENYGYLRHQERDLFIHYKDFAERHKRPAIGDNIHYQLGKDSKNRRCAVNARHVNDGGKITIFTWICVFLLSAAPALAWTHLLFSNRIPLYYLFVPVIGINALTYLVYKKDKQLARAKQWRTSEATLHFLEFFGGWPAAYLAQRQFRHKCAKTNFQCTYWFIILVHHFFAIDYLIGWRASLTIIDIITQ